MINFEEQASDRIRKSFVGSEAELSIDTIKKGKKSPIGTIANRKNGRFKKVSEGRGAAKDWEYIGPLDGSTSTGTPEQQESIDSKRATVVRQLMDPSLSSSSRAAALIQLGVRDPETIVGMTGADLSDVMKELASNPNPEHAEVTQVIEHTLEKEGIERPTVTVDDLWDTYESFLGTIITGEQRSLLAYGSGGIGKTYTMKKMMKQHVINEEGEVRYVGPDYEPKDDERFMREHDPETNPSPEEYDYVKITGSTSAAGIYKSLYEHNGKVIIFDDCDSVFDSDEGINVLKGALDTDAEAKVSWNKEKNLKLGDTIVPKTFAFNGSVIFITNIPKEKMQTPKLQPIAESRATQIDMTMTSAETMERLDKILYAIEFYSSKGKELFVSKEDRKSAYDFIDKYKELMSIGQLNTRTLSKLALIKKKADLTNKDFMKQGAIALGIAQR